MNAAEDADRPFTDLGEWLSERRGTVGLKQHELAQASGVSQRNIQRHEGGQNAPDGPSLLRLLSALSVEIKPLPPARMYGSVNAELRALREELQAAAGMVREDHATTHRLLRELAEAVADLGKGLKAAQDAGALQQRRRAQGGKR